MPPLFSFPWLSTDCPPRPSLPKRRFLLTWAFADLEASADRPATFALLRAMLGRRLVAPEVYDLMGRVQELVVQVPPPPLPSCCLVSCLLGCLVSFFLSLT